MEYFFVPTVSATVGSVNIPVSRSTPGDAPIDGATAPIDGRSAPIDGRSARWTEHRASRREQLIDAALRAVADFGVDVGMDQIAQVARTSKPVIYRYFADKGELHRAMGERIIGNIVDALAQVEGEPDPQTLIRRSIDAYLTLLADHPELFRFVTQNRVLNEAAPAEFNSPVAALLTRSLAGQLAAVGIDPAAAQPWGEAVVGFIRAASLWWIEHPEAMTRAQLSDYLAALLWGGGAGVFLAAGHDVDPRPKPGVFARVETDTTD
jgi:AcrR family transcriptional regulator